MTLYIHTHTGNGCSLVWTAHGYVPLSTHTNNTDMAFSWAVLSLTALHPHLPDSSVERSTGPASTRPRSWSAPRGYQTASSATHVAQSRRETPQATKTTAGIFSDRHLRFQIWSVWRSMKLASGTTPVITGGGFVGRPITAGMQISIMILCLVPSPCVPCPPGVGGRCCPLESVWCRRDGVSGPVSHLYYCINYTG